MSTYLVRHVRGGGPSHLRTAVLLTVSPLFLSPLASPLAPSAGLQAQEGPEEGERVVIVYDEPRHRLVVDGGEYKLLDIQIQPGDTTLWHTHNSPIMYTFINTGDGSANGRVSSNTNYLTEPRTHEVTNDGTELFQIIAIASYLPPQSDLTAGRPDGIDLEPQLENPWFRSYRIELQPGETTPVHKHRNPSAVVQVTDGAVDVLREDGFGKQLTEQGDWAFREAEGAYRIRNSGDNPVSVAVNEVRAIR